MLFRCTPYGHHHAHAPAADSGHSVRAKRGRKTLAVDIHCHVHVPAADVIVSGDPISAGRRQFPPTNDLTTKINTDQQTRILPQLTDVAVRLADMDRCGVDIQAISPAPAHYNYDKEPGLARDAARIVNDRIAEICGQHPDRFVGMGTLPFQNPDMAVAELERCVKQLGLRGIEISTNIAGKDLTRAGLEKFFARCEELGVLIFMHPIGTTASERMRDHYFINTIGHPLESALAVGYLVHDGYLERYPGLKICIAHGGGYIPGYWGRFDHPWKYRDDCRVNIKRPPSEYIKKLYFDTVVFDRHQLASMVSQWGADHVIMGTDYPYDMAEPDPVGFVDSTGGLSAAQRAAIKGGNAAALLGLDPRTGKPV